MQGIDISSNNHGGEVFNFGDVKAAGYDVVYVKATQDANYVNPYFIADVRDAMNMGLRVGVYHFFGTTSPPIVQADWFLRNGIAQVEQYTDLLPVLDFEASMSAESRDVFLTALGRPCGVYMDQNFYKNIGYGKAAAFGWLAWPGWTNEALPIGTAIVQTGQALVEGIGSSPAGPTKLTDIDTIINLTAFTDNQPAPPTEEIPENMISTVELQDGTIVTYVIIPSTEHVIELTRQKGTQGEAMTTANTSVIDVTDAFPSEVPS
jgi:hypothetical protein